MSEALPESYATIEEFEEVFGHKEAVDTSAIDNPVALSADPIRLSTALVDATNEIDSYLATKYDVTALRTSPPRVLKRYCCDIARYYLLTNRSPELYRQRYEDAIRWLRDVAAGKIDLGLRVDADEIITNPIKPRHTSRDRRFTREIYRSYH